MQHVQIMLEPATMQTLQINAAELVTNPSDSIYLQHVALVIGYAIYKKDKENCDFPIKLIFISSLRIAQKWRRKKLQKSTVMSMVPRVVVVAQAISPPPPQQLPYHKTVQLETRLSPVLIWSRMPMTATLLLQKLAAAFPA